MNKPEQHTVGDFTFAHIDSPNDRWCWAIVMNYEGPQEYGEIICTFDDGIPPNAYVIRMFLEQLNFEYDTGSCDKEDLVADA